MIASDDLRDAGASYDRQARRELTHRVVAASAALGDAAAELDCAAREARDPDPEAVAEQALQGAGIPLLLRQRLLLEDDAVRLRAAAMAAVERLGGAGGAHAHDYDCRGALDDVARLLDEALDRRAPVDAVKPARLDAIAAAPELPADGAAAALLRRAAHHARSAFGEGGDSAALAALADEIDTTEVPRVH